MTIALYGAVAMVILVAYVVWQGNRYPEDVMENTDQSFSYSAKYELVIVCASEVGSWTSTEQFAYKPMTDTIKALVAEAVETHIALYDLEPSRYVTSLKQLELEDSKLPLTK